MSVYAADSTIIAGIATVALLLRNDVLNKCHRERSVAIPKIGVRVNMHRHSEALPKPLRQVAPSSARYACHLSRFNGRAYSRKGGIIAGRINKFKTPTGD